VIKIQSSTTPIVWQIDNSYNLPHITGQVRWNGSSKCFEVDDSYSGWMRIDNTVQLTNDPQLSEVLTWAQKKMEYERKLEKLIDQYPAVKDAKEKLDIIMKLVQDDNS
jgi:hypothetical protein